MHGWKHFIKAFSNSINRQQTNILCRAPYTPWNAQFLFSIPLAVCKCMDFVLFVIGRHDVLLVWTHSTNILLAILKWDIFYCCQYRVAWLRLKIVHAKCNVLCAFVCVRVFHIRTDGLSGKKHKAQRDGRRKWRSDMNEAGRSWEIVPSERWIHKWY